MSAAFLGLPYLLWAGGCVVVALLFALILPFKPGLDGMTAIALLGGITYAYFLATVVVATSKATRRR
ncbi:MAG: hypothetical protein E6I43_03455 [Chloroflexi bacterium]|nr:MAG: hypothetical protein E6I43_03455 [Chloroflexota bacterium]